MNSQLLIEMGDDVAGPSNRAHFDEPRHGSRKAKQDDASSLSIGKSSPGCDLPS